MAASPSGGGTVSPASGFYNAGQVVALSASAAACYQFTSWSGDASGSVTPMAIAMNAPSR
ncbi:MAG: hypothetical protein NT154_23805 [Verrucomicrobia bacterium]|nr:hypothetical protein [Verrucomicrobiota bacterium]